MYNGWQSPAFPTPSGVKQGSPLSPLLYGLGAQPLASHLSQQASQDACCPVALPDSQNVPVSPVWQSSTEQWGWHFALRSAALHWCWVTAHLDEERISTGVTQCMT